MQNTLFHFRTPFLFLLSRIAYLLSFYHSSKVLASFKCLLCNIYTSFLNMCSINCRPKGSNHTQNLKVQKLSNEMIIRCKHLQDLKELWHVQFVYWSMDELIILIYAKPSISSTVLLSSCILPTFMCFETRSGKNNCLGNLTSKDEKNRRRCLCKTLFEHGATFLTMRRCRPIRTTSEVLFQLVLGN